MKFHFKYLIAFLCANIALLGSFASAQEVQQEQEQEKTPEQIAAERFKEADTDGDGGISRGEFRTYLKLKIPAFEKVDEFMNRLDADQNNQISPKEFLIRQQVIRMMVAEDEIEARQNEPTEFADIFNARFLPQDPKVGTVVPGELQAFDEKGDELKFEDLRGKYTVINFGCLT